jgi:heparan-alpha-glucosaminide N-acetyltransferase
MQVSVELPPVKTPDSFTTPRPTQQRYVALDAFRGFVMLGLCSRGFGWGAVAKNDPSFAWIAAWFDHVPWEGMVFWDFIQPAFLFMVGLAMPFAMAKRAETGATQAELFRHALARSVRLILLSQILISISGNQLQFQLINVLSQMGFTYLFCHLILQMRFRRQVVTAALILAFHAALYALFPGPDGPYSKDGNIGAVIDRWWLGRNYSGYYVTINFISSIVSTLAGAWVALLIRSRRSDREKLQILAAGMAGAFASGLALAAFIPNVKRLWTASFTLYSTGWVLLALIVFFWLFDMRGYRKWAFPLAVVGMNSIFVYSLNQVLLGGINRALGVFTGNFEWIGKFAPLAQATALLMVLWYLCYWLYQRKIFFKL